MTLKELSHILHKTSVAGYFNGEKFAESRLLNYMAGLFRVTDKITMQIALPDGWWYFDIWRYNNSADGYTYRIPETRQEERRVIDALLNKGKEA